MAQVKLIVSNWKMNLNFVQAKVLVEKLKKIKSKDSSIINIICPQFLLLPLVSNLIKESKLILGAQDCHYYTHGAFTGDTSIKLIKKIGCKYIIAGHSERRQYHFETDKIIRQKVDMILFERLKPIICVGESANDRKNKNYLNILKQQLKQCVPSDLDEIIIAYEPVWSIGSGLIPKVEEIKEVKDFINKFIKNSKNIEKVTFLYGGSVSSQNLGEIFKYSQVDGALIGGSSLKIEEMNKILTLG